MHHTRLAHYFLPLGLCLLLPGAALAGAKPSFNCAKASSVAEKAICGNAGLAAADVAIAAEFKKLQSALDPKAAAALAEDQRWFVGARDAIAEAAEDMAHPELGDVLKDRLKFLRALNPHPSQDFVGSWYDVAGGLDITAADGGRLKVAANTANPANGNWVCDFEGAGKVVGDALEVREDGDGPQSGLRLTRVGASLKVAFLSAPGSDETTPSYCGLNGSLEGDYFSVPAGYK